MIVTTWALKMRLPKVYFFSGPDLSLDLNLKPPCTIVKKCANICVPKMHFPKMYNLRPQLNQLVLVLYLLNSSKALASLVLDKMNGPNS